MKAKYFDPGQGTPVLIVKKDDGKDYTASWSCGTETGELDGYNLTDEERNWLEKITPEVEAWMEKHGA